MYVETVQIMFKAKTLPEWIQILLKAAIAILNYAYIYNIYIFKYIYNGLTTMTV